MLKMGVLASTLPKAVPPTPSLPLGPRRYLTFVYCRKLREHAKHLITDINQYSTVGLPVPVASSSPSWSNSSSLLTGSGMVCAREIMK